jgi:hypothetical protein
MRFLSSAVCALSLVAAGGVASANPFDIAILSTLGAPASPSNLNVVSSINNADPGLFNITVFDVAGAPGPDATTLETYRTVLVISGEASFWNGGTTLGNTLAQYISDGQGRGLVIAGSSIIGCGGQICGDFSNNNDWAINPGNSMAPGHYTMGTPDMAGSPLLAGVSSFDGGSKSFRAGGGVNGSATEVAHWSDGIPLIAIRTFGAGGVTEVGLNFYPVSSAQVTGSWDTGGGQILANAIMVAGNITQGSGGDGGSSDLPEASTCFITAGGLCLIGLLRYRLA